MVQVIPLDFEGPNHCGHWYLSASQELLLVARLLVGTWGRARLAESDCGTVAKPTEKRDMQKTESLKCSKYCLYFSSRDSSAFQPFFHQLFVSCILFTQHATCCCFRLRSILSLSLSKLLHHGPSFTLKAETGHRVTGWWWNLQPKRLFLGCSFSKAERSFMAAAKLESWNSADLKVQWERLQSRVNYCTLVVSLNIQYTKKNIEEPGIESGAENIGSRQDTHGDKVLWLALVPFPARDHRAVWPGEASEASDSLGSQVAFGKALDCPK